MSRMCMSLHTFKAGTPNPKYGLLSSRPPLLASTISVSKTSEETFLEVVAAGYLLCSSSGISEVLMVVLAVYTFFSAF